jgi:hypothetical protein
MNDLIGGLITMKHLCVFCGCVSYGWALYCPDCGSCRQCDQTRVVCQCEGLVDNRIKGLEKNESDEDTKSGSRAIKEKIGENYKRMWKNF